MEELGSDSKNIREALVERAAMIGRKGEAPGDAEEGQGPAVRKGRLRRVTRKRRATQRDGRRYGGLEERRAEESGTGALQDRGVGDAVHHLVADDVDGGERHTSRRTSEDEHAAAVGAKRRQKKAALFRKPL